MIHVSFGLVAWAVTLLFPGPTRAFEALDAFYVSNVSIYADVPTIEVWTRDEDGAPRETTIWIVVVDDGAYINTHKTTWGANVERTRQLQVCLEDASPRRFGIRFLEEAAERERVQAAFRAKYGFEDKLLSFFVDPAESTLMRLVDPQEEAK